jgi:hypothetical protein
MKRFQHRAVIAPHGSGGRSPRGAALALSLSLSLIMLITTGPVTAGEWGKVDLQQSTTDWVKNCGIFSFMDIETFGFFYVYSGPDDDDTFRYDLCARGQIDMGFGDRNARAPADAPDLTDVALIAPKIILGRKSRTSECVYDVGGLDTSANPTPKFVCPEQTVFDPAGVADALPDLTKFKQALPFPAISSAGADIVVPAKGTKDLLPGDYGNVVVGEKGRLVFKKKGTYNFKSIRSVTDRDPMYVEFKEPKTTVNVVDYLLLGHRSEWNNAATPTIKVYVAGAGPYDVPKWSPTEVAFRMKGDGHFHSCWVYSPNGTQIWEGHSHEGEGESGPDMDAYHTQSFANQFIQESSLNVKFAHPQDPGCYDAEYTCAAIGRIVPPGVTCDSASGVVSIPAWNASEKTLSYVGLISENASLPLAPTVKEFIDASCVMFRSGPSIPLLAGVDPVALLTYLSPGQVENVIEMPDIWAAGVLGPNPNCPDIPGVDLVPVALGPIVDDDVNRPPVCFSAATFQFLRAEAGPPDTCTMVDP